MWAPRPVSTYPSTRGRVATTASQPPGRAVHDLLIKDNDLIAATHRRLLDSRRPYPGATNCRCGRRATISILIKPRNTDRPASAFRNTEADVRQKLSARCGWRCGLYGHKRRLRRHGAELPGRWCQSARGRHRHILPAGKTVQRHHPEFPRRPGTAHQGLLQCEGLRQYDGEQDPRVAGARRSRDECLVRFWPRASTPRARLVPGGQVTDRQSRWTAGCQAPIRCVST